nr:twin-arginine translocation signal domain-containing protein [Sphingobium sp. BS19]
MSRNFDRRQLLRGATLAGGGLALSAYMPAWAQPVSAGTCRDGRAAGARDTLTHVKVHARGMINAS